MHLSQGRPQSRISICSVVLDTGQTQNTNTNKEGLQDKRITEHAPGDAPAALPNGKDRCVSLLSTQIEFRTQMLRFSLLSGTRFSLPEATRLLSYDCDLFLSSIIRHQEAGRTFNMGYPKNHLEAPSHINCSSQAQRQVHKPRISMVELRCVLLVKRE